MVHICRRNTNSKLGICYLAEYAVLYIWLQIYLYLRGDPQMYVNLFGLVCMSEIFLRGDDNDVQIAALLCCLLYYFILFFGSLTMNRVTFDIEIAEG